MTTTHPAAGASKPPFIVYTLPHEEGPRVAVTLVTPKNARYLVPGVSLSALKVVLEEVNHPDPTQCFILFTDRASVLSVPFKEVQQVYADEEVIWRAEKTEDG